MTPLVSIVTGTYNRFPIMRQMVDSIRSSIPAGLPYEIVLVDGGSTDDTLTWARQQRDIVLIEQGELLGGIKAFNAGAYASRGRYVVLANDDIIFHAGALLRAFAHLEDHPTCGGVAFADDRRYEAKIEITAGFGVGLLSAQPIPVIYAQVGMFRRWLGELVGWWGHDDPIMHEGHTYGGDSYLSARLWELGYSIDAVKGCSVKDLIYRDTLRDINHQAEQSNPGVYYKRYPNGPTTRNTPIIPARDEGEMRILYFPIYEPGAHYAVQKAQKRGLRDALARMGLVWEHDYCNEPFDLTAMVRSWRPDVMVLQCHAAEIIDANRLAAARAVHPSMVVINWNGDVWEPGYLATDVVAMLRHVDLMLGVNLDALDQLTSMGIATGYWQNGFEPVKEADYPDTPAHDVVILMSNNQGRRNEWEAVFDSLPGDVGLYGSGWKRGTRNTTYNFAYGRALCARAKITIGDNQHEKRGFVSNRLFEAMAAGGAILLQQHVPQLEQLTGLKDGVHYVAWTDGDDLREKVAYWLNPKQDKKRLQMAKKAKAFIMERHSFEARVEQLFFDLLPTVEIKDIATA